MPRQTKKAPSLTSSTEPHLIRIPAAANMLGVSERFIRRLVSERRIRYYKIGEVHVCFDPADVVAYREAGRVEPIRGPL